MDEKKIEIIERLLATGRKFGILQLEYESLKVTFNPQLVHGIDSTYSEDNIERHSRIKNVKSSTESPDEDFESYQKLIDDPLAFEEDQSVQAQ